MTLTRIEARVKAACLELIAAGRTPTGRALLAAIPGHNHDYLVDVRNRLVSMGEIPALPTPSAPPAPRKTPKPGLIGRGDAEKAEVAQRVEEIRAAKMAAGERA